MKTVVRYTLIMAIALALIGCAWGCARPSEDATRTIGQDTETGGAVSADGEADLSVSPNEIPGADTSLSLEDRLGRTPADAFSEHIAAVGSGDPKAVWKTYGSSPPDDYDTWRSEWEDAAEVYFDTDVLEERVVAPGLAYVRVVYRVTSGDDEAVVEEPGEWWRVEQVDGAWRIGWLPWQ